MVDKHEDQTRLLLALLQLWVQDHRSDDSSIKIEFRLAAAGLTYHEIAGLLGKKPDAVRMLLARNKEAIKNI
jgi:hypothetical protein